MTTAEQEDYIARLRANVPEQLRQRSVWLCWKSLPPKTPGAKPRKLPVYANGKTRGEGLKLDSPEDRSQLASFEDALSAFQKGKYAGLGVALGEGLSGVDLDDIGPTDPRAAEVITTANSYTETSPSGTGLKIFGTGVLDNLSESESHVEIYGSARFFAVTGLAINGAHLADLTAAAATARRLFLPLPESNKQSAAESSGLISSGRHGRLTEEAGRLRAGSSDADVIWGGLRAYADKNFAPPARPDSELREIAEWVVKKAPPTSARQHQQEQPRTARLVIESASTVVTRPVQWLVKNVFALRKLSMIAGDPGVAKSTITLDLAASITGTPALPWLGCVQGDVLILSAEDDAEDTIVPRLIAAGADLSKCHILRAVFSIGEDGRPHRRQFNLKNDLELLEAELQKYPNVVLMIIDPISAYMSGTDSHRNSDVREVLAPVADFAARLECAVVVVHHLNKSSATSASTSAIYRLMGSIGFGAAVRSAVIVVKDAEDEKRRLFVSVKNNNAPEPEGALAYRVENQNGIGRLKWDQTLVDISAQDALNSTKSERDEETDTWLTDQLSFGARRSTELFDEAKKQRISVNRLKSSKQRLRVCAVRRAPDGDKPYWAWELPPKGDGSEM